MPMCVLVIYTARALLRAMSVFKDVHIRMSDLRVCVCTSLNTSIGCQHGEVFWKKKPYEDWVCVTNCFPHVCSVHFGVYTTQRAAATRLQGSSSLH